MVRPYRLDRVHDSASDIPAKTRSAALWRSHPPVNTSLRAKKGTRSFKLRPPVEEGSSMKKIGKGALFCLSTTLLAAISLEAQQTNVGNINGIVRDTSGAVIPGAPVLAINQATGLRQETTTSGAGDYRISLLPIGIYTVSVTKSGFSKAERTDVPVISAKTFTVDFDLP